MKNFPENRSQQPVKLPIAHNLVSWSPGGKTFNVVKPFGYRFPVGILLLIFSLSLQSFSGIQIEKRHYRKGYYVHVCHDPKTYPVYTGKAKKETPVKTAPVCQAEDETPERNIPSQEINPAPGRSIAPVIAAPRQSN